MKKIYRHLSFRIKQFLNFCTDVFHYRYLKRHGVETKFRDVKLVGLPMISRYPGSRIILGKGVTLVSNSRGNIAGVNHPVILATLSPEAIITLNMCGVTGASICAIESVTIGQHSGLGANASVYDTDFHPVDSIARRNQKSYSDAKSAPVLIGEDVWVGANSLVLKGVTIADKAVVGAGSVVTRDVGEGEFVAGNPAKFIRKIA